MATDDYSAYLAGLPRKIDRLTALLAARDYLRAWSVSVEIINDAKAVFLWIVDQVIRERSKGDARERDAA